MVVFACAPDMPPGPIVPWRVSGKLLSPSQASLICVPEESLQAEAAVLKEHIRSDDLALFVLSRLSFIFRMIGPLSGFQIVQILAVLCFLYVFFRGRKAGSLPPGPKGWPIIGNALDMPTTQQWLTFTQWGDTWGVLRS